MWKDLMESRSLASRLTIRDFKAQYRQSALGVLWAFLTPILNTLVWIILQGSGVVKISDTGIPFVAYVFSGTMLWAIFTESLSAPLLNTQQSKSILSKINFPREALLLSALNKVLINTLIRMVLIILALLLFGVYPGWNLLLMPVFVLAMIMTGFTLGLLITPVGMLYTDVGRAIPLLMPFLMYFCPVIYRIPETGTLASLIRLNPLTPLVVNCRNTLTGEALEQIPYMVIISAIMAVLLLLGWFFYRFSIPIIVERSSS